MTVLHLHDVPAGPVTSWPVAHDEQALVDGTRALEAVCGLAGAIRAEAIAFDRLAGTLQSLAASARALDLAFPALVEAVHQQTGLILGDPRPRWIPAGGPEAEALFVMKLGERGPRTFFAVLAFPDDAGMARARMAKLAPDLARLIGCHVELAFRLHEAEERSGAAMAALQHGECGVIAIRSDRSVIFHNGAAAACMEDGVGLHIRRGRIGATDGRKFEAALQGVLDEPSAPGAARLPATVTLAKRGAGARPAVVVVAPTPSTSAVDPRATGVAALIYILDPSRREMRGLEALC